MAESIERPAPAGSAEASALRARVEALLPMLAAEAVEAERLRRPTDAAIRALEDAGYFRMLLPRAYGGLELDLDAFLDLGLLLGEADTSLAWVSNFCVEHNWIFCQFPEAFQKELYAEAKPVLAPAVVAPTGSAVACDGGWRVSGRWQWGTGVMHCSWVVVSAMTDPDERASLRFFALPRGEVQVPDTWYVSGMVGTGSNDIVVEDVFVPEAHSAWIPALVLGQAEGARLHAAPLYRTPMIPLLLLAASTPVVGQARAVLAGFRERVKGQMRMSAPGQARAERAAIQARLAQATLEQRQAELLLADVVRQVMTLRNAASQTDRAGWAAAYAHVVHQCRRVIDTVAVASGASAHFQSHPLQRALRDANVASCHVAFDADAQYEQYGKLLLGFEVPLGMY